MHCGVMLTIGTKKSVACSAALTSLTYTDEQLAVMGADSKVSLRQAPSSAAICGVFRGIALWYNSISTINIIISFDYHLHNE